MLCVWCGQETPDDSVFCEKCGYALEGAEAELGPEDAKTASVSEDIVAEGEDVVAEGEGVVAADESVEEPDIEPVAGEEELPDEAALESPDNYSQALPFDDAEINVDAIRRSNADEPLVEPPSPPIQPKLSPGFIAVVGTIALLFAAAVILLSWASIMRFLGL